MLQNLSNDQQINDLPEYIGMLIYSLFKSNKKIWINPEQISNKINNDELLKMYINKNEFGEYIKFLQNCGCIIYPIFETKWLIHLRECN